MTGELEQAIRAINTGDRRRGYELLAQVIKADPRGKDAEVAWLWMSLLMHDPHKKIQCLEAVLKINPDNANAIKGLAATSTSSQPQRETASPTLRTALPEKEVEEPKEAEIGTVNSKECPFCAEIIRMDAILCRFCGSDLQASVHHLHPKHGPSVVQMQKRVDKKGVSRLLSLPVAIISIASCIMLITVCVGFDALGIIGKSKPTGTALPTRSLPPTFTPLSRGDQVDDSTEWSNGLEDLPLSYSISELVNQAVGTKLDSFSFETFRQYKGQVYPEGRTGYEIDITVTFPNARSREEMLRMAYVLMHEFYYNFADRNPYYLFIHLRAGSDSGCVFGAGIGHAVVGRFVPKETPDNLESWFQKLVISKYYGDEEGQSEANMAYGNDPSSRIDCPLAEWTGK
jgi:hypothetical protein